MILLLRCLTAASVTTTLFTLACVGGALTAIRPEEPAMHYTALDFEFVACKKGSTLHVKGCPALPKLSPEEFIWFRSPEEAARQHKQPTCPLCGQLTKNADAASISSTPSTTPTPTPISKTSSD